jgi:hypothetical protein
MSKDMQQDIAKEPVDLTPEDDSYMDTGVLYDERICVECGDDLAAQGYKKCTECMERTGE